MSLLSSVVGFGKQVAGLVHKVNEHDEEIQALNARVHDLGEAVHRLELGFIHLTHVVESLRTEMRYEREAAARDRENMLLHMRNMLLEQGRIPPASPPANES